MSAKNKRRVLDPQVSELMRRTATITLTALGIIGIVFFLFKIQRILIWILIGVVLTIALLPAVAWFQRHRFNRTFATITVVLIATAVIGGLIVLVAVPVVTQASEFLRNLSQIAQSLFGPGSKLASIQQHFHVLERLSRITPEQVLHLLAGNRETLLNAVTRIATLAAACITILTITVMLLLEGPKAWRAILRELSEEHRLWAIHIGENFIHATGGYIRGSLSLCLIAGVTSFITLKILHVPYAETLAVFVAILDIIPLVGATIAAIVVALIGVATCGTNAGIVLLIFFVIYQQFENNVLQNLIYSKTVAISPLLVFVAALSGAALAGLVGALLAIPLASALWSLVRDFFALRQAQRAAAAAAAAVAAAERKRRKARRMIPEATGETWGPRAETPAGPAGEAPPGDTEA